MYFTFKRFYLSLLSFFPFFFLFSPFPFFLFFFSFDSIQFRVFVPFLEETVSNQDFLQIGRSLRLRTRRRGGPLIVRQYLLSIASPSFLSFLLLLVLDHFERSRMPSRAFQGMLVYSCQLFHRQFDEFYEFTA